MAGRRDLKLLTSASAPSRDPWSLDQQWLDFLEALEPPLLVAMVAGFCETLTERQLRKLRTPAPGTTARGPWWIRTSSRTSSCASPVRCYRHPPSYFHGRGANAPPRWCEHWGQGWEAKHGGWERVAHAPVQRDAPVPTYQRQYTGKRYPAPQQQAVLHSQHYWY